MAVEPNADMRPSGKLTRRWLFKAGLGAAVTLTAKTFGGVTMEALAALPSPFATLGPYKCFGREELAEWERPSNAPGLSITSRFGNYFNHSRLVDAALQAANGKSDPGSLRLTGWQNMIDKARKIENPLVRAQVARNWVLDVIEPDTVKLADQASRTYTDDPDDFRRPDETLRLGKAVCSGYSILLADAFLRIGFDPEDVILQTVIIQRPGLNDSGHMVVGLRIGEEKYVYDLGPPLGTGGVWREDEYYRPGANGKTHVPIMAEGIGHVIAYDKKPGASRLLSEAERARIYVNRMCPNDRDLANEIWADSLSLLKAVAENETKPANSLPATTAASKPKHIASYRRIVG